MLKMADKISNLSALLASPPAGWSAQRRAEYFEWAREVVEGCRTAHTGLAGLFDELAGASGGAIGANPNALGRVSGVRPAPGLSEGVAELRG